MTTEEEFEKWWKWDSTWRLQEKMKLASKEAWLEASRRQEERIDRLKEILKQCYQTILELCPDMDIEYGEELKKLVGEK